MTGVRSRDRSSRPGGPPGRSRPSAPGGPSTTRPTGSRRSAAGEGSGATARTSAPAASGRFTGRAIVLGVVLLALVLSYVFPVRVYLAQQAEIAELRQSQERQRAYIEELAAEAERWEDDEYVRMQARKRLNFAEPGEILLVTVWDEEDEAAGPEPDPGLPAPSGPWWDTLWTSVESANQAGAGSP